MKAKTPSESLAIMTEIVLPNDTNNLNNLFGGQLMSWMDRCCAIAAARHADAVAVTASVNQVSFNRPIPHSTIVTMEARVSRAFKTSMEVYVDVYMEDQRSKSVRVKCNEAIYTFVALDDDGNKAEVAPLEPETEIEKERYAGALRRRQLALILAGKMKADEATELKALFT